MFGLGIAVTLIVLALAVLLIIGALAIAVWTDNAARVDYPPLWLFWFLATTTLIYFLCITSNAISTRWAPVQVDAEAKP